MKVQIVEQVEITEIEIDKIVKQVKKEVAKFEKIGCFQKVTLIVVDNKEIQKLNLQFRDKDYATDVLSFPSLEKQYLGEIFISKDKVIEQSAEYGHSLEREFAFLLVHGILHLLGYDHHTSIEEKIMFGKQNEILKKLPYRRIQDE